MADFEYCQHDILKKIENHENQPALWRAGRRCGILLDEKKWRAGEIFPKLKKAERFCRVRSSYRHKTKGWWKNMRKNAIRLMALLVLLAALPALALAADFAVVKGGRLNLRQSANSSSKSLGLYNSGSWVQVLFRGQSGFAQVKTMDGKQGYMAESYLNFGASPSGATVRYASGGYVNLRSGPSLDYDVLMRVTSGTTITIMNDSYEWNYVAVPVNGSTVYGYMHDSLIDRGATSTATVTTRYGGKVNVRTGPSSSYKSAGSLATGTRVTVLLRGNGWCQISGGGLTGFMSTSYLSGMGSGSSGSGSSGGGTSYTSAYVNNPRSTQVLNLRESPSQTARSVGQYRNGTQVKVVSYGSTWCEVYVGTRHGYMMTRYLSFNGSYVPPTYPTSTPVPVYPTVTPTPTPLVEYITPKPTQTAQPGGSTGPAAGTAGTLAVSAGSGATTINMYAESTLTTVKATYAAGQRMTILQYGPSVCMIMVGSEVGYVSTWNVNY